MKSKKLKGQRNKVQRVMQWRRIHNDFVQGQLTVHYGNEFYRMNCTIFVAYGKSNTKRSL
jgi:hypothetical protein